MAGIRSQSLPRTAGHRVASLPKFSRRPLSLAAARGRRWYQLESTRTRAASASDPYQVLGVSRKTSSENVQRAYRARLLEAKKVGDDDMVNTIEQAHSSIMMEELSRRMQGKANVSQDIAYADKAVYLPWRPRFCLATGRLLWIGMALQLGLLLYAWLMRGATSTQPIVGSAIFCACIVYFKLEKLFPSGSGVLFTPDEGERKQGAKNLLRCAVLALMGTAAGIVLFFTLPDLISNFIFHKPLPYWVYDNQDSVLNAGVIVVNLLLSVFFR